MQWKIGENIEQSGYKRRRNNCVVQAQALIVEAIGSEKANGKKKERKKNYKFQRDRQITCTVICRRLINERDADENYWLPR